MRFSFSEAMMICRKSWFICVSASLVSRMNKASRHKAASRLYLIENSAVKEWYHGQAVASHAPIILKRMVGGKLSAAVHNLDISTGCGVRTSYPCFYFLFLQLRRVSTLSPKPGPRKSSRQERVRERQKEMFLRTHHTHTNSSQV